MRFVVCVSLVLCLQIVLTNTLEVRIPRTRTTAPATTVHPTTTSTEASLPSTTASNITEPGAISKPGESATTEDSVTDSPNATEQLLQNSSSTGSTAATDPAFDETSTVVVEVTKRDTVTEVPLTTSARFKTTLETMSFNVNDFNSDLKCGIRPMHHKSRNRIKRIVGGSSATEGEWPWQVIVKEVKYLGTIADYKCGGVLISERHVLTAAHCKPRAFLSTLVVILGQHRLHEKNLQTIPVTRMIVHKHFNEADFDNDLAVLELKYPVDFSSKIVPICLPDLDEEFVGRSGYVTGWGKLAHKGGLPKVLQNVKLPIIARENCQQMFLKSGHVKKIHDYFLCAGYEGGQLDACEGDSGGPLSVQRPNGQWVLAGTVSHGIRCAEPNLPGVYMNISYYRSWIERMMTLHRTLRSPQEPEQRWFRPLWSVVDFYKKRKASVVYISK